MGKFIESKRKDFRYKETEPSTAKDICKKMYAECKPTYAYPKGYRYKEVFFMAGGWYKSKEKGNPTEDISGMRGDKAIFSAAVACKEFEIRQQFGLVAGS